MIPAYQFHVQQVSDYFVFLRASDKRVDDVLRASASTFLGDSFARVGLAKRCGPGRGTFVEQRASNHSGRMEPKSSRSVPKNRSPHRISALVNLSAETPPPRAVLFGSSNRGVYKAPLGINSIKQCGECLGMATNDIGQVRTANNCVPGVL